MFQLNSSALPQLKGVAAARFVVFQLAFKGTEVTLDNLNVSGSPIIRAVTTTTGSNPDLDKVTLDAEWLISATPSEFTMVLEEEILRHEKRVSLWEANKHR